MGKFSTFFFCFYFISFLIQPSQAQLQIYSTGQIALGSNSANIPPADMVFSLSGKGQIEVPGTLSKILIESYPLTVGNRTVYHPQIGSTSTSSLNIGSAVRRISRIYTWDINTVNSVQTVSDRKFKRNIVSLESSLSKVLQLRSVRYDLIKSEEDTALSTEMRTKLSEEGKNQIGFIAQEVKELMPEVVNFQEQEQFYTMNYSAIIPFLTKAIQEQQVLIEDLQAQILSLRIENAAIANSSTTNAVQSEAISICAKHILYQNIPNPFKVRTQIKYSLAADAVKAQICIYTLSGRELKCLPIPKGEGSIWIEGGDLEKGVYLYALLVDGNLIDMKKMILTD